MKQHLLTAIFLVSVNPLFAQPTTGTAAAPAAQETTVTTQATPSPAAAAPAPTRRPGLTFGIDLEAESSTAPIQLTAGKYAVLHTSEGDILVDLLEEKAPKTVENFVGLASGQKSWKHPVTQTDMNTPLYNNTTIFKTVENALLYGGDPINRGEGDPGYTLPLETSPDLRFDTPGLLATSSSGANASGSRWFLTLRTFPDWSGRHTIFGKVIGGMDVARAISRKPTKRPTVPLDPVLVTSIEPVEIPAGKSTTAGFIVEDGKKFVTIEKEFKDQAEPTASPATDAETTGAMVSFDAPTTPSQVQEKGAESKQKK